MILKLLIAEIILVTYGWCAIKYPVIIAKILTLHLRPEISNYPARSKSRHSAQLIWTDPIEWRMRYPEQISFFRLTGFTAFAMAAITILTWIMSLVAG
ncbi:MAG: hypothetical protein KDD92_06565 [Caldilineaceae bacterium]|nr:hypothetical protein [Caldilineaceae bacterium]